MNRRAEGSDCVTGKAQYVSKSAAQAHIRGVRAQRKDGARLNAFRCAFCECYHVGNKGGVRA